MTTKEQLIEIKKDAKKYKEFREKKNRANRIWKSKNKNYMKSWIKKNEERYYQLQINYWTRKLNKLKIK